MKFPLRHTLAGLGAFLALGGLIGGGAQAAPLGTAAGTSISNIATVDYTIGGVPQGTLKSCATACTSTTGSNTSFVVDNKVSVLVVIPNTTFVSAIPGSTAANGKAAATFTVTNQGNKIQDLALNAAFSYTGGVTVAGFTTPAVTDSFDPTACTAYIDDGTPGYQGTEKTFIDELASGDSATVTVACAIPAAQVKGDIAVISLKATAKQGGAAGATVGADLTASTGANDPAVEDIVFADAAGVATGDVASDAAHSAYNAFKVNVALLTTLKQVATLCDPINGNTNPKDIPGSFVRYTITITNAGTAAAGDLPATLTTLSDTLASTLSFDTDLISGASAAACVTGGAATSAAGSGFGVTVSGGTRANNGTRVYKTSSAGDADGASANGQVLTLDLATLLPAEGTYTAGLLNYGESVQVIFNAKIN